MAGDAFRPGIEAGQAAAGAVPSERRVRAGTLYVVATPIGNLADVTLRAIEVLRAVPLVAAEDTRVTRRLLARHGIEVRLTSFHARNAAERLGPLVDHLRGGADLALVTDAGTPGVSDPGTELVRAWSTEGGTVVPIPGASAVMAAVSASGIAGPRWSFDGFLPRSGRERAALLARIAADDRGTVLFEAPGRLAATLAALATVCGPDRPAAVARELTKIHEEILHGTLGQLAAQAAAGGIERRGEAVVVVGAWAGSGSVRAAAASSIASRRPEPDLLAVAVAEVEGLVRGGMTPSAAVREVASRTGVPRRILYQRTVAAG